MTLARAVAARPRRWRAASLVTIGALLASIVASTVPPTASVAAAGTALQLASASWVPGFAAPASNVALQLNGSSQYGTVGTASQLRSPTFTLELWFRRTGAGIASANGTGNFGIPDPIPLMTKGRAEAETAAADINYFLGIDASSGELVADFEEARIAQGGTDEGLNHPVLGTTPIAADGAWHHAAATYDGTTWNLYLDGVLDGSAFIDRPAAALTNVPTTVGSALTTTAGTGASGFFAGVVDEVRIWNFARSVAEINATKNVQITSAETGLLGAWNMNAGNGTMLADSTGNIATGGLVGAPGAEYATLGTTTQLRSPTFTVELWFSRTAAGAPSASGTGTGGIARPIPLITKGRAEAETAAADVNYFLGIDFDTGTLVADFEEAQIAQGGTTPGLNHPITGTGVIAADGAWHHAAATYDGATWNLFLDGILDGTLAVGRAANASNTVRTAVGTALTTASAASGFFAGVVDEVRIWSVARTLAQINATKDIEITTAQPNLMGVWNLNAGTGTSLADSSGNGIVGAAVNTPAWVPGFEAPLPGSVPPTIALDAPANGAAGIGTSPSLRVSVADANGDSLKVSFFGRPAASGNFALLGTNSGVTSGTVSSLTWSGINDAQKFEWFATVTDSHYLVTGPTWTFTTADGPGTVFVGAGDIADCARTQDEATAAVIDGIAGRIWTSGDNVYNSGTATEFASCYDASWGGDIKARTRPAPGNHDWGTGNLNGYNGYFGAAATDAGGKSYYSYDADSNWHIVVLDSECAKVVGGCGAASAQVAWMRADLAANSTKNVVVIWHKPRYGSGTSLAELQPFHDVSYEFGVDIILIGHDHFYERLTPIDATGAADATHGGRQFIVGTGGAALSGFSSVHPRSVARNNTVYGVLRLTLHASSYDWKFFPIAGQIYADAGTSSVHGPPPSASQSPDAPTVNAPADDATGIDLSPTLDVNVSDPNGDPLTVTFFGRPLASGNFTQIGQSLNVPSGTNTTAAWAGLGAGQEYEWFVTVDDETGTPVTTGPTWQFHTVASADPVFVGTGDIASCAAGVTEDTETGNLIRGIDGVIWTTGDNVYPNGTAAEFANCYETTPWGDTSVQSRTRPVPGNHDWGTGNTENLNGYFGYYGNNATDAGGNSYYSYDIDANWHVVNLDSECQLVPGGCAAGSPQEVWLRADLAANADQNVIAVWHKPRYSTGTTNYQAMAPLWDAIYDGGVDILLDGHDHIYERTAPMRAGATLADPPVADPTHGIRQFTVGTGGEAHHGLTTNVLPTSQASDGDTFGVLKLTLHATTYDWVFLPIVGSTFTDFGSGSVHDAPDTTPPPPPTIDTAPESPTASTSASFTFSATEGGVTFE
ncbi:MAG TPA: LamG-like jellyroll fold domain-containing protein, partial [Candidatus Dormibacteraeota bacterium]|nr:LamG-like jellyroll fold domain-containing protein [Candidatus Dormibacteraeota bacterium]